MKHDSLQEPVHYFLLLISRVINIKQQKVIEQKPMPSISFKYTSTTFHFLQHEIGFFTASGPGQLAIVEGMANFVLYERNQIVLLICQ